MRRFSHIIGSQKLPYFQIRSKAVKKGTYKIKGKILFSTQMKHIKNMEVKHTLIICSHKSINFECHGKKYDNCGFIINALCDVTQFKY